jgi:phospholipase C
VCKRTLDHTSVLQLLAEKFTPGSGYSVAVNARRAQGVESLSVVLDRAAPRGDVPKAPAFTMPVKVELGTDKKKPTTALEQTFEDGAREMVRQQPKPTAQMYPAVSHWVLNNPPA